VIINYLKKSKKWFDTIGTNNKVKYLIRDDFLDTLPAGVINGTPATPGPGTRVVTDSGSKLSMSGGSAVFSGGNSTYGDPTIWSDAIYRIPGRIALTSVNLSTNNKVLVFNLDTDQSGNPTTNATIVFTSTGTILADSTSGVSVGNYTATQYCLAIVMRSAGMFYFIKGGSFTNWTLLYLSIPGTALLAKYPSINNYSATFTSDFIRVPFQLWLPIPLASDSFNRENGTIGVTDGRGHSEANGGGGLVWTGAGATISGSAMAITPTEGAELSSGSLVVDTWYRITATQTNYFYASCAVNDTFKAASTTGLNVNNKVVPLTLATLFSTVSLSSTNVIVDCEVSAVSSSPQSRCGAVARLDSAVTPTSFIYVAFNPVSSSVGVIEVISSGSYTTLLGATKAFTASDHLILSLNGNAWRCYHTTSGGTATLLGSGTTNVTTGNLFGGFSTYSANKINSFVVWAKGNEGQYNYTLNKFIR
jgi:hypothetical protein